MNLLRRLLSILLLAAFGLPFATPLLALTPGSDANLPACCRRNGAHHCAMSTAERARLEASSANLPEFHEPPHHCPFWPAAAQLTSQHEIRAVLPFGQVLLFSETHIRGFVQTEVRRRTARERNRHKRGPPSSLLA